MEELKLQKGCTINKIPSNINVIGLNYLRESKVEICPFCGSKNLDVYHSPFADVYDCLTCGSQGAGDEGGDIEWRRKRKSLLSMILDFFENKIKEDGKNDRK